MLQRIGSDLSQDVSLWSSGGKVAAVLPSCEFVFAGVGEGFAAPLLDP